MGTFCAVVAAPTFNDNLGLAQAVEDLAVEQLVTQAGVETFDIAILPWAAGRNVGCLGANGSNPAPHRVRDELGAIVRSNVGWHATEDEEIG